MNLSITDGKRSYYWCSKDVESVSMTATAIANWVKKMV
jgi:hypothetical protein